MTMHLKYRRIIAERMSPADAVTLLNDRDWVVRYTVVQRVAPEALGCMLDDPEPDVRAAAQERLTSHLQGTWERETGNIQWLINLFNWMGNSLQKSASTHLPEPRMTNY